MHSCFLNSFGFLQNNFRQFNAFVVDENELKKRKSDLNKIVKFLLRQTSNEGQKSWETMEDMTFWQYLYEVGMFETEKEFQKYTIKEKLDAKYRYLDAISVTVKGSAMGITNI